MLEFEPILSNFCFSFDIPLQFWGSVSFWYGPGSVSWNNGSGFGSCLESYLNSRKYQLFFTSFSIRNIFLHKMICDILMILVDSCGNFGWFFATQIWIWIRLIKWKGSNWIRTLNTVFQVRGIGTRIPANCVTKSGSVCVFPFRYFHFKVQVHLQGIQTKIRNNALISVKLLKIKKQHSKLTNESL